MQKSQCKTNITVYRDGIPIGFVKSISYDKCTFKLTCNKERAKGYTVESNLQYDIDFLAKFYCHKGYVFLYN